MLYLIHFDRPFKHARHYLGFCEEGGFEARMAKHRSGQGSRLIKVIMDAGIDWKVVRTWPGGTRTEERVKKNGGHLPRLCPICKVREAIRGRASLPLALLSDAGPAEALGMQETLVHAPQGPSR